MGNLLDCAFFNKLLSGIPNIVVGASICYFSLRLLFIWSLITSIIAILLFILGLSFLIYGVVAKIYICSNEKVISRQKLIRIKCILVDIQMLVFAIIWFGFLIIFDLYVIKTLVANSEKILLVITSLFFYIVGFFEN